MVAIHYRFAGSTASEIGAAVEEGIRTGALAAGSALPSVRGLAAELGVAPGTVAHAYKLLAGRGLVVGRGRSGTLVRPRPAPSLRPAPLRSGTVDLASGQPGAEFLPTLDEPLRLGPAAAPDAYVRPELRDLLAARLRADGVDPESLTLTFGGLDGIGRVLAAHLVPGDLVAVEDPGWPNALELVSGLGLRAIGLVLDSDGPTEESLGRALRAGAAAVLITNRAQNPTGGFLGADRAIRLRALLAEHPDTLVVEDDHAAELAGVPLATCSGATRHWAFVRSTSKPYGPDLRLAVVAGDRTTIGRVDGRLDLGAAWVSTLVQSVAYALLTSPAAADQVAAAATAYDRRRAALIAALDRVGVPARGATGINVWVPVADETAVVADLAHHGWAVAAGTRFRLNSPAGIRITVSALPEARIEELAQLIAAAMARPGRAYSA